MCFSASVSFGASALLAGTGVVALQKIESPKMFPFACTPILFSVHQLTEGFLWLSLQYPDWISWYKPALYSYLFISQAFWPFWIPFIIWIMEPDSIRKKWVFNFWCLGVITFIYILYCLLVSDVSAFASAGHIRYNVDYRSLYLKHVLYSLTVVVPVFLSSFRYMKLLGGSMVASLILSYIFYEYWVISVWCFFAAILSALVLLVIANNKESVALASIPGFK